MGSTFRDIESEAKDQEKISLGVSVFCCCMIIIAIALWAFIRNKSQPMHNLQRSMGRMQYVPSRMPSYAPPRMPSYGPGRFSASSPMMPHY